MPAKGAENITDAILERLHVVYVQPVGFYFRDFAHLETPLI